MFGTVWYWDPSFLTFISFLGFVLTIGDYVVPNLLAYIISVAVVLFPKIHRQGLLQKGFNTLKPKLERIGQIISAQFEILANKVQHTVKEKYTMIKT